MEQESIKSVKFPLLLHAYCGNFYTSKLEVWTESQKPSPHPKNIKYKRQVFMKKPELDQKGTREKEDD